jgi:hypothetical protein
MKELTLGTLIAVFEEMFGKGLFWLLVVLAVLVTAAYIYVLVRDRALSMKKFFWAQVSMPFGAVAAVALIMGVTHTSPSDLGGPLDVIVFIGIAALGAVGASILVYTLQSLVTPLKKA